MNLEQAREYIRQDVEKWFAGHTQPMRMQVLSQRYGKVCSKYGIRVIDAIESDEELIVRESDNGSRLVVPKVKFNETFSKIEHQINFWKAFKVSLY